MTAIGIDLGGTKIETQIFDDTWSVVEKKRRDTPPDYAELVNALVEEIEWGKAKVGADAPAGIGVAGLINPLDGLALTANLPATGHPFPSDVEAAAEGPITFINDGNALALSEAVFGVGKNYDTVITLILGTGVGGGVCVGGRILDGPTQTGGEFGHTSAPAHLVKAYDLPIVQCGCGRMGCIETFISGPGLSRIAKHVTGQDMTPPQIAAERHGAMREVWNIWCNFTADLLHSLTLTADPDLIVLGGGLSKIEGVVADLTQAALEAQLSGFTTPPLMVAEGGDTSGARGAAYAAWQAAHDG